ncbi:hypothetical protein [Sedimentibacter saalensis]|uniref:Uncharacterized protein n=1 Tax=Sedimentibacter saalensis TaxID=130788 RepID=A0A562JE88_9FIRM|nr:hypothetical protein [Sedimentibacter saalensis]TWH81460.1 hypothetical protein LY60_01210 [Sedimentibacter saalensis]
MKDNKKILFCLLGSFILVLLKTFVYYEAGMSFIDTSIIGGNFYNTFIRFIINLFSFSGFVLTIVFAIILIINNINLKK